ncbi:S8 family serine peptidase [Nocardioides sp. R-C-SC26]|uniref:S8 family peptidase n=1 Tax=Nocardioides sp. R-C-SC26 TaxID=2870414 RepID=UPI001E64757E|nr:S8 family serine peptidase [Nocardioides sp. R-C-SC26]
MRVAGVGVLAVTAALGPVVGSGSSAQAAPGSATAVESVVRDLAADGVRGSDAGRTGGLGAPALARGARASYFVRLVGDGAAAVAARTASDGAARRAAVQRRASIETTARQVAQTARRADPRASALFTTTNTVPGVALRLDAEGVARLSADERVLSVARLPRHTVENSSIIQLEKAVASWRRQGNMGQGVRVGVIDTGIDYTHATFGGPGTVAAYEKARSQPTAYNWRARLGALGRAKVLGGYDFVGDDYNADPAAESYQPVPRPDPDPIDCGEHGTHVAGTLGGYGVTARGTTFTARHQTLNPGWLDELRVGPGTAPKVGLYGLKVFGCEGSTDAVIPALDWSLDPNGDGLFDDRLDIVNLSLGYAFSPIDDPEVAVADELARHGVLAVFSAGNDGDITDIAGSNAASSLVVASTVDASQVRDGLRVDAPSALKGVVGGQVSSAYPWLESEPVGGEVAVLSEGNADGCDPLGDADAAAVQGRIAWLEWDDDDATRRCGSAGRAGNVAAAGAIGALFTSDRDIFGAGILGIEEIPVFQLTRASTGALRSAAEAGDLAVTFDGALLAAFEDVTPGIVDQASDFTSRGSHGSLGVSKPDVAAVGDSVFSAYMGTGSEGVSFSGTSMAAPNVAGIAAMVKSAHPGWGPLNLKAAIMNSAGHDVWTGPSRTGKRYGPLRVGAGRVDALAASRTSMVAYARGAGFNAVTASFGVVRARTSDGVITRSMPIAVRRVTGKGKVPVRLSYESLTAVPGVSFSVRPNRLMVGRSPATATLTLRVDPTALRRHLDPTMAAEQVNPLFGESELRQFVTDASGRVLVTQPGGATLRIPVTAAPKPVAAMTATATQAGVALGGQGLPSGEGATAAKVAVLEWGAESPLLPLCVPLDEDDPQTTGDAGDADDPDDDTGTGDVPEPCTDGPTAESADLAQVGAGSTNGEDGLLWFGIAAHRAWENVGNLITPYVDIDVDGDEKADYEIYVERIEGTDLLYAWTIDLDVPEGEDPLVDVQPVNFADGGTDTNVFDTDVLVFGASKAALGLPSGTASAPISYTVGTYSLLTDDDVDTVGPVAYDAGTPSIGVDAPLFDAAPGDVVPWRAAGSRAGAKALVLRLHNAPGSTSQVLEAPAAAPTR